VISGLVSLFLVGMGVTWTLMFPTTPQEGAISEVVATTESNMGADVPSMTASAFNLSQEILPAYPSNLVLTYVLLESKVNARERGWPTYSIWIKKGAAPPERLAAVGKEGEYPTQFILSPDHQYIAINLEKKLQLLNVRTKELRTVFATDTGIIGLAFSSDSSHVWVSDNSTPATHFLIHSVDVASGKDTLAAKGDNKIIGGDFWFKQVRADGIIFYDVLTYSETGPDGGYFDLRTQEVHEDHAVYGLSEDGKVGLGDAVESIPGHCSEFGPYTVPMIVRVVEPVTGEVLGTIGRHNEAMHLVAFSPDGTQVLFGTNTNVDCVYTKLTFYLQTIQSDSFPVLVSDPNVVLEQWNKPRFTNANDPTNTDTIAVHNIVLGTWPSKTARPILQVSGSVPNGTGTLVLAIGGYYLE